MNLNFLSIGKRLALGFFIIGALICATMLVLRELRASIVQNADNAFREINQENILLQREIDHHIWVESLLKYLTGQGKKPLTIQMDGNHCAFGSWFNSADKRELENAVPATKGIFVEINTLHLNLHKTAATVKTLTEEGKHEEALKYFENEVSPIAEKLFYLFKEVRETVNTQVQHEITAYREDAKLAGTMGTILSVVSVLMTIIVAFLLAKSITKPMQIVKTTSDRVAHGHLDERIILDKRSDEFAEIAESINSMIDSLNLKISESEAATHAAEQKAQEVKEVQCVMREIAEKEHRISNTLAELTELVLNANDVADTLSREMQKVSGNAEEVRNASESQTRMIDSVSTAMDQISKTTEEIARNAGSSVAAAAQSYEKAIAGQRIVEDCEIAITKVSHSSGQLQENMEVLGNGAESIGAVMSMISDIADQTNLLALNAAIEAARAGEAGRGFAVVADEVRKLAEKTMLATKEVGEKISSIQQSIQSGIITVQVSADEVARASELSQESGRSLAEIVGLSDQSSGRIHEIAVAAEQHVASSLHVTQNLADIAEITTKNNQSMKETVEKIKNSFEIVKRLKMITDKMSQL